VKTFKAMAALLVGQREKRRRDAATEGDSSADEASELKMHKGDAEKALGGQRHNDPSLFAAFLTQGKGTSL
jgi:hypothetical protein